VEAANGQSTIVEKLEERLNQDKSPGAMDKTSNETSRASKDSKRDKKHANVTCRRCRI
jgi:hypothetical protein